MELVGEVEARVLSVDDIRTVADRRTKLHSGHATRRPLTEDYDFIGLMGQWEFARKFGLAIDLTDRPAGDGRLNFWTDIGTISVSTFQKPHNLLREVGKECAAYHVLAKFKAEKFGWLGTWRDYRYRITFLGWQSDETMLEQPTRDFGYGIVNHYMLAKELRPIIELRSLLLGVGMQRRLL